MNINKLILVFFTCQALNCYADFEDGGIAYLKGDYESAAKEFIPLAERGDHRAMYALGSMYTEGHGVEKDLKKAFKLFTEAAQNGRADAMYKLGMMYEEGLGIKQNFKKALRFYQKSAKQGYPLGQYKFGLMYVKGKGVKKNPVNAYAWLVVAGHYFIYELADSSNSNIDEQPPNKRRLLLFQQEEKERVFDNITKTLLALREELNDDDIKKIEEKVIKFSKYRRKYQTINVKNGRIDSKIEHLYLPETLY